VTVKNASVLDCDFDIKLTCDQPGIEAAVHVDVKVVPNLPYIVAAPASLAKTMLRGQQTLVEFQVRNDGAAPATGVEVVLPSVGWMTLSSPAGLGDMPPGEAKAVVLSLMPAPDQTLGDYSGGILIRGTNATLTVPYTFRAIAEAKDAWKSRPRTSSPTSRTAIRLSPEPTSLFSGRPTVQLPQ